MSAPWPRHSLWGQHVTVCLGHHTGWRIFIPRVMGVGEKVFTREFLFSWRREDSYFWAKIFFPGRAMKKVGFSLGMRVVLFPGGCFLSLWRGLLPVTSRGGGEGYTARKCSVIKVCEVSLL